MAWGSDMTGDGGITGDVAWGSGMTGDGGTGQWRDTPLQLTKWRPNE